MLKLLILGMVLLVPGWASPLGDVEREEKQTSKLGERQFPITSLEETDLWTDSLTIGGRLGVTLDPFEMNISEMLKQLRERGLSISWSQTSWWTHHDNVQLDAICLDLRECYQSLCSCIDEKDDFDLTLAFYQKKFEGEYSFCVWGLRGKVPDPWEEELGLHSHFFGRAARNDLDQWNSRIFKIRAEVQQRNFFSRLIDESTFFLSLIDPCARPF